MRDVVPIANIVQRLFDIIDRGMILAMSDVQAEENKNFFGAILCCFIPWEEKRWQG